MDRLPEKWSRSSFSLKTSHIWVHQFERGQGKKLFFPVVSTRRIGSLARLILTLVICDDHTYIPVLYTDNNVTSVSTIGGAGIR